MLWRGKPRLFDNPGVNQPPRFLIEQIEAEPVLPAGTAERFNGYGVMGQPFESGHVLALRRFPASSVGPGYSSVWHRSPQGKWAFYANVSPEQGCTRFFGTMADEAIETDIELAWTGPYRLKVTIPAYALDWQVEVAETPATRLMNSAARSLPKWAWLDPLVLSTMANVARPLLGVGRVGLRGRVPNGQSFIANPRALWAVVGSHAKLAGQDLGPPGPVQPQARLRDFWIPQRGMLAIGQAYFEAFDSSRHSSRTAAEPS